MSKFMIYDQTMATERIYRSRLVIDTKNHSNLLAQMFI